MSNKDVVIVKIKPGQRVLIQVEAEHEQPVNMSKSYYPLKSLDELLDIVSEVTQVPISELIKKERGTRITSEARFIFCWLAYVHYEYSYSAIGRKISRDHTTVMSAVKVVKNTRGYRPPMDYHISELQKHFPFIL